MASAGKPGLIILGNSGVGKSFLANQLLEDDEAFESRFSARSVTRHTEWKDMETPIGRNYYSVANIPGLVEANQKSIDENRHEIMKAFEAHPWAIVIFVFGHKNGRIPDEDLVAFTRINDAYEIPPESLLFIVNGIPPNRPDDYEEKSKQLLHELTHVNSTHIYFIEMAKPEKSKTDIRELLHRAIEKCELREHTKKKDIELIAEEIARLKLESKQRQEQLLAQVNEHSNQKQTSNLPPNSTVEEPRSSEESCSTNQPRKNSTSKTSDEMMKAMRAEHDQTMAELKAVQQNLHRYAIEQCPEPLMRDDERDRQRIEQMSSSPQTSDKRRENKFSVKEELTKAIAVVGTTAVSLFRGPPNEHQHRRNSQDHNHQHNFQSSAPHHNDQNNN